MGLIFFQFQYLTPNQCYRFDFLDVGQGDAILISTPQQQNILIDGGPGQVVLDELSKAMPWWDKTIDLVILTHPHADHLDGLLEVIKRFKVHEFYLTGAAYKTAQNQALFRLLIDHQINYKFPTAGTLFELDNLNLEILYPETPLIGQTEADNINNTSIASMVEVDGFRFLFTGDAEIEQEQELLALDHDYKANLFQAGHHGSRTSNSPEFISRIQPEYTVIQSGLTNSHSHPHSETIRTFQEAGTSIYRTDLHGQISFRVCSGQVDTIRTSR